MSPSNEKGRNGGDFRIANGPLVRRQEDESEAAAFDLAMLPRTYGAPILFAIPRDPRTLFTYWNVDWDAIFAREEPYDRKVYLRVLRATGIAESEWLVEPLLGSYYALVTKPRAIYRVELGYYQPAGAWHSVAISDAVQMPAEKVSESLAVDVATVPFHLSFQRMIDTFRISSSDSITTILSRLQGRALTEEEKEFLSSEELEILNALRLSIPEVREARHTFLEQPGEDRLRRRAEAVLGFGTTSPAGGFGGTSWSSSPS